MKHLLIGGGGFIGTNMCRHLLDLGHRPTVFGHRPRFPEVAEQVDWIAGDTGDTDRLKTAAKGADIAYHMVGASLPGSSNSDMPGDVERNVIGSIRMLEALSAAGVGKVVFLSSGGTVYGVPEQLPTPETAATDPISSYGITKLTVEKYLKLFHRQSGFDYAVLRVSNPYGPYQLAGRGQGVVAACLEKAMQGGAMEVWGDGSVARDFVYIGDVVDAMERAGRLPTPAGVYNVGSGVSRTVREVVGTVENVTGRRLEVDYKPARPSDVPATALDIRRAGRDLGWAPTTGWEDGISWAWTWMRGHTPS